MKREEEGEIEVIGRNMPFKTARYPKHLNGENGPRLGGGSSLKEQEEENRKIT